MQDHEDEGMARVLRTERGKEAVRASRKTKYTHPAERTGGPHKQKLQIQKPEKFLQWSITHLVYKIRKDVIIPLTMGSLSFVKLPHILVRASNLPDKQSRKNDNT